jgi:hypothetical protein
MPSDSNHNPGTPPVSSAGFSAGKTAGKTDPLFHLPTRQETDSLLAEAAALEAELFRGLPSPAENDHLLREAFASQQEQLRQIVTHHDDDDLIDDLAEMDFDDPRYLIVDEPPTEENPE